MRTITATKWVAAVVLAASLTAPAQENGDGKSGGQGGIGRGGPGGQHQRPTPEQMAEHAMAQFDANKDGELSQEELTQALQALREHHPRGPGGGGSASNALSNASQGGQGWHRYGPKNGGGQQGLGQGGQGGQQQEPPSADKVAAQMIAKFSSDGKGLTQAELVKAMEAHRANRRQHGGGQQGAGQQGAGHPLDSGAGSN